MLVLSRKQGQVICVGDDIKLTVIRTQGKSVRIGIEAPDDVHILRGELREWTMLNETDRIPEEANAADGLFPMHNL